MSGLEIPFWYFLQDWDREIFLLSRKEFVSVKSCLIQCFPPSQWSKCLPICQSLHLLLFKSKITSSFCKSDIFLSYLMNFGGSITIFQWDYPKCAGKNREDGNPANALAVRNFIPPLLTTNVRTLTRNFGFVPAKQMFFILKWRHVRPPLKPPDVCPVVLHTTEKFFCHMGPVVIPNPSSNTLLSTLNVSCQNTFKAVASF